MKKIIIVIGVLFILMIAGAIYGKNKQTDWVNVTAEDVYIQQFSNTMPDVILDPMVGFSLY